MAIGIQAALDALAIDPQSAASMLGGAAILASMRDEMDAFTAQNSAEYTLFVEAMLNARWSRQSQLFGYGLVWRHQRTGRTIAEAMALPLFLMQGKLPLATLHSSD